MVRVNNSNRSMSPRASTGGKGNWIQVTLLMVTLLMVMGMGAWYNNLVPEDYMAQLNALAEAETTGASALRGAESAAVAAVAGITSGSSAKASLKSWRKQVQEACVAAGSKDDLHAATMKNTEIFAMPQADNIPALPRSPEKTLKPCRRVVMDFGANIGDTSAHVVDSGMVTCDRKDLSDKRDKSPPYFAHFNVETKKFEAETRRNPLTYQMIKLMKELENGAHEYGPEDYCYYGVEGNPVFTPRLQAIEDFVMAMQPRPIQHMHFLTESVGAGEDGMTKLYLDTINTKENFWGSSIFSGHQDVRKSAQQEGGGQVIAADVMGYTIGSLMRKTLAFFDPNAAEEEKKNNHLVLKVDIEGGEYPLLYQAGEEGTLCEFVQAGNTADLFIEFHSQRVTGHHDYVGKMKDTKDKLAKCGVTFRNLAAWWA